MKERRIPLKSAFMKSGYGSIDMRGSFKFLGTGGSMGVPVIGCPCSVCASSDPHNNRLRSSGILTVGDKTLLIDVGPDFREQALKFKIKHIDGVLLTHPHFDHVGGLDDLRVFYFIQQQLLPCLLSQETMDDIKLRYHYMMRPLQPGKSISAQIAFHLLDKDFGSLNFEGVDLHYFTYHQGGMKVTGFRVGNFAYVSDIREYSPKTLEALDGVELLVVSALRQDPTPMHFSIGEAIAFSRSIGAKKTYFTHLAHDLEHEETERGLPPGFHLGYDGLQLNFDIS